MTNPINLNKARKTRDKAQKKAQADQNAAKFGRTKSERILEMTRTDKAAKMLDQHLIEDLE